MNPSFILEKENKVFEYIKDILCNKEHSNFHEISRIKIKKESRLREDLGLDSLDVYEIVYFIEEKFAINIPDGIICEFKTIKNILIYTINQI